MPLPEPKIRKSGGKRFQRQTEGNFLTGHKLKPLFLRTTWKTDPPRLLQTYDLKMLVMENDRKNIVYYSRHGRMNKENAFKIYLERMSN